jgi:hypothetical protein
MENLHTMFIASSLTPFYEKKRNKKKKKKKEQGKTPSRTRSLLPGTTTDLGQLAYGPHL